MKLATKKIAEKSVFFMDLVKNLIFLYFWPSAGQKMPWNWPPKKLSKNQGFFYGFGEQLDFLLFLTSKIHIWCPYMGIHKKNDPQVYTFSDYVESKNRSIRSFSPIKSSWHTHEHGSEFNSDPCSWVCRLDLIGLNDQIGRFFDST